MQASGIVASGFMTRIPYVYEKQDATRSPRLREHRFCLGLRSLRIGLGFKDKYHKPSNYSTLIWPKNLLPGFRYILDP